MAAMKTDKDYLNNAQYESDESTIKRNKQRLLKIRIAVLKMNICQVRVSKTAHAFIVRRGQEF